MRMALVTGNVPHKATPCGSSADAVPHRSLARAFDPVVARSAARVRAIPCSPFNPVVAIRPGASPAIAPPDADVAPRLTPALVTGNVLHDAMPRGSSADAVPHPSLAGAPDPVVARSAARVRAIPPSPRGASPARIPPAGTSARRRTSPRSSGAGTASSGRGGGWRWRNELQR